MGRKQATLTAHGSLSSHNSDQDGKDEAAWSSFVRSVRGMALDPRYAEIDIQINADAADTEPPAAAVDVEQVRAAIDLTTATAGLMLAAFTDNNRTELDRCTDVDAEMMKLRYAMAFLLSNGLITTAPIEAWEQFLAVDLAQPYASDVDTLLATCVERRAALEAAARKATGL